MAIIAYTVGWGGGWYISTHRLVSIPDDTPGLDISGFQLQPGTTTQENLHLSCRCSNPVVSATLDAVTITSSKEATVIINFTNPDAEDINLSFEYVTLQDPKDGNKVYKGDYDSFVVPAKGSMSVPVVFHINTSQKKIYTLCASW